MRLGVAGSSPRSAISTSRILNFWTLPVTVIGKASTKLHVARDLVVGDLAAAEVAQLVVVELGALAQDDPGHDLLAVVLVGHADDLDVGDRRDGV